MPRHLITAALPYANGPVHIGHLAGCYIPADIYTRYLRLKGEDVLFICGSDEHGVPITIKAKQLGITPQQVVDKYHKMMKDSFAEFGISFDHYSRTSAKIHHETASDFFKTLYDKEVFEEETTQQYYDEEAKQFLADRYITGTCPNCGNENAYGDQCENCGRTLNATDLINPKSKLSGNAPVLKPTKNWFLPLNKYQDTISDWIGTHKEDWKINVYGQCMSWINDGLKPRAMTRDLDWGVKVPLPDTEGKVLYVWFDAPIGYISATKEFLPEGWEKYWKTQPDSKDNSNLVHFIGKDNIVFHCIIFPAMLMAHGDYVLPVNVPANEFLNLEGDKISTSRNWAVWLHEYLQDFPGREDELRYVLTSIAPETKDSEFTWMDFQARINNELCAIVGNFINRIVVLSNKYFNGKFSCNEYDASTFYDESLILIDYTKRIENFNFRDAQAEAMKILRLANGYLTAKEPWKKFNINDELSVAETKSVLMNCVNMIKTFAHLIHPFMPKSANKIFELLKVPEDKRRYLRPATDIVGNLNIYEVDFDVESFILFKKIEDFEIQKQIDKLHATKSSNTSVAATSSVEQKTAEIKPETTFDDFNKMDIRVATILEAERVPKTDKLLKLLLDTGIDRRTVVSGIAANYEPEKIIGQKVVMLANLAPRKIKGIESKGMILMAENEKGELSFVSPTKIDFNNGSNVK